MQAGSSWRFCESVFRPLVIDLRTPVGAAPRGEALKMEAVLRELGYRRAVLDAVPPTKNAQLLYEAMGFLRDTSLFCESNAGYPVLCI